MGKLKLNIEEKMNSRKDKHEEEKDISAVDKIKQKYGYATNDVSKIHPRSHSMNNFVYLFTLDI